MDAIDIFGIGVLVLAFIVVLICTIIVGILWLMQQIDARLMIDTLVMLSQTV